MAKASATAPSAHRLFHKRGDLGLFGGSQLAERVLNRHMAPSSSFALSLKPSVWYLTLNFPAFWKKQTTLPSLAYAGIPYQVLGTSVGAAALIRECTFLAMARSGPCIFAIAASTSVSPSALAAC